MTDALYTASIPVFKQMLQALSGVLHKAEEHAAAKKIDPTALLQARLFPDMFPLLRQVMIASDFAKGAAARLAGVEVPVMPDTELTFAELQTRIATVLTFINSLDASLFDKPHTREIVIQAGTPRERTFDASTYLLHYAIPQFFFHVTTAYALLRHNGVEIGKKNYMGVN
ncbi:DUF1993 domain-containing protein [Rhodoferax saidenbachensis]|uniref:DUF1993 domain-containing protein n=1 Tax=Rhodoferax saidenbachensis TaxID=1484693 RepID=A0ABU1ZIA5_9BURK|nr:DUF1993 domain-containing protein [Rhodoferax saidenbachensis]MDR7305213.1 hypothetical protein [Rhodoferax saidenbachensis]